MNHIFAHLYLTIKYEIFPKTISTNSKIASDFSAMFVVSKHQILSDLCVLVLVCGVFICILVKAICDHQRCFRLVKILIYTSELVVNKSKEWNRMKVAFVIIPITSTK